MKQAHDFRRIRLLLSIVWLAMMAGSSMTRAALPSLDPPEHFFTNIADRLLQQQLGVRLGEIQVAPTNQYDTAVHRLFQVTANLYDATSTNEFPAVFRPLFETRSNGVFLAGFTNDNSASTVDAWLATNPYGLPMVIAARKGFPNFNEFTHRSDVLVQRKLEVTRTPGNPPLPGHFPNATNQMYVVGLSNFIGVEAWNSYDYQRSGPYPRPVALTVSNFATLWMSNDLGMQTGSVMMVVGAQTNIASGWLGGITRGFVVPMQTNQVFLSNAVYRFANNTFANISTNAFEINVPGFPLPYWILGVSNRLQFMMTDGGRVIDFVLLGAMQTTDLYQRIVGADPYLGVSGSANVAGVWNTNRLSGLGGPTEGIKRQMDISLGFLPTSLTDWRSFTLTPNWTQRDKDIAIDAFRWFWGLARLTTNAIATNNILSMVSPFNPAAKLVVMTTWQVNDPLVHYRANELNFWPTSNYQYLKPNTAGTNISPSSLGRLNDGYSPWGGNPFSSGSPLGLFDRSSRDPHVYSADDWNFPAGSPLASDWLGRVHRGTPWQTLYLKADAAPLFGSGGIDPSIGWINVSPDLVLRADGTLFSRTHPTNDWRLVALLASLFNTNDPRTLTSVNTTNTATWAATFNGLTVLSNSLSNPQPGGSLQFVTDTITAAAPQIATLVEGINRRRAAERGQYFADIATFLSVSELSSASPWLNLDFTGQQANYGLNDEAYEMLPSQLLSLVRADPAMTVTRSGQSIELRCVALDGYAYRVESSTNLTNWATVSEPHYTTNGVFTLTVPASGEPQFFRVVWLP